MTIRSHLAYACSAILLAIIIAMSAACGKHTGVPPPVAYGDPTNGWTIYGPAGQNIIPIELDAGAWQVEYCVAERPGGANLQISVSSDTQIRATLWSTRRAQPDTAPSRYTSRRTGGTSTSNRQQAGP